MDIRKQVGQLIQDARKEKGWTQRELGEKLGISESAVNRYEGGTQNFTVLTLQKIAAVTGKPFHITIEP